MFTFELLYMYVCMCDKEYAWASENFRSEDHVDLVFNKISKGHNNNFSLKCWGWIFFSLHLFK